MVIVFASSILALNSVNAGVPIAALTFWLIYVFGNAGGAFESPSVFYTALWEGALRAYSHLISQGVQVTAARMDYLSFMFFPAWVCLQRGPYGRAPEEEPQGNFLHARQ